jgi:hypothetical protein
MKANRFPGCAAVLLSALCAGGAMAATTRPAPEISFANGKLVYAPDARGNRVLDYSTAGYGGGGVAIPDAPVRVTVPLREGDATARLQAAIDYVSSLPLDERGIRGAVLLEKGRYSIGGSLIIAASGVVLRGQGQGADGTVLFAAGTDRRTLLRIAGTNDFLAGPALPITDPYVPVNATTLHVQNPAGWQAGATVQVRRPSTEKWINDIGMFQFPGRPNSGDFRFSWRPGQFDVMWNRTITGVEGDRITLDAPLTSVLDFKYGPATVSPCQWPGALHQCGIENLRCDSAFDPQRPLDEEHAWIAIGIENARDCWVRQVTATHFCSSLASLMETTCRITVADCQALDPVSEIGGYRRHAFFSAGQQTLFLRCHSEHARHDFAFGYESSGPSAVVNCDATGSLDFSGTVESWASGVLFDSVEIPDHSIRIDNREIWDQGAGWTGVSCMLWNCQAPLIALRTPPGEKNWAFGCWGVFLGEGPWGVVNEWVDPPSLYLQQLRERLGEQAVAAMARTVIPAAAGTARSVDEVAPREVERRAHPPAPASHPLALRNGWLTCDQVLLTGAHSQVSWWKGHVDPQRASLPDYGPAITRFAPGRTGAGVTDDLDALTDTLLQHGQAAFAHNWGLWYDQRRQDHEQVRRLDGNVEPPFFEQAWARSGQGTAFDGLSKYDLTKFNPWYFGRLRQFANLAEQKGLVLINQMYFQHHLLEDAAHWMDVPWRVTNALQDLGFPEPPPIVERKRIIAANLFYDVSQPKLREFHRAFIRHQLDTFVGSLNVIFTTGEEFNGPLAFMQFWLDTIAEWERETGQHPLVALCCTKDVQDAILADPERSKIVDVIYMKYWWYTADGGVYNPPGGEQVAPRKQLTAWKGNKKRSDESTARQVREYRGRFPGKAILCATADDADPWAVAVAGGSIVPIRADAALLAALPRMLPWDSQELTGRQMALADKGRDYLVYSPAGGKVRVDLTGVDADFAARWVNPSDGKTIPDTPVKGGAIREFTTGGSRVLLWLTRK